MFFCITTMLRMMAPVDPSSHSGNNVVRETWHENKRCNNYFRKLCSFYEKVFTGRHGIGRGPLRTMCLVVLRTRLASRYEPHLSGRHIGSREVHDAGFGETRPVLRCQLAPMQLAARTQAPGAPQDQPQQRYLYGQTQP